MLDWYCFDNDASVLWTDAVDIVNDEHGAAYDHIVLRYPFAGPSGSRAEGMDRVGLTECIDKILLRLKPDGRILVIADNVCGISSWCGRREAYSGIPFEGIDGGAYSFHRKQLEKILSAAGLTDLRFFYPVSDGCDAADDPVAVFSDEALPGQDDIELLEQVVAENLRGETGILTDGKFAIRAVVDNGVFPFFADCFVVDAGRTPGGMHLDEPLYLRDFQEAKNIVRLPVSNNTDEEAGLRASRMVLPLADAARENRRLLAVKGRSITIGKEIKDADRIRRVHEIQIDILRFLRSVCDEYGLTLYPVYGTLLGAVRHDGIIPGDDDIDVALPREDYDRLVELAETFPEPYFLQTTVNDDCFYGGYLKLRNKNTTAINPQNWWVSCCEGISIDIFPMDYGYNSGFRQRLKLEQIRFYQRLLYAKAYGYFPRFQDMPLLIWKAYKYFGKLFTRKALAGRLDVILRNGDKTDDAPYGIFTHYARGKSFGKGLRRCFEETVTLYYDGMTMTVPAGYDELLCKWYTDKYMYFPMNDYYERRHAFYVPDEPYPAYKKRFSGLFRPAPEGKRIVLFADDVTLPLYWSKYGNRFIPDEIVVVMGEALNSDARGARVTAFADYSVSLDEMAGIYPVICSVYIRDAEKMVRELGFTDYYIFVYNARRDLMLFSDEDEAAAEARRIMGQEA